MFLTKLIIRISLNSFLQWGQWPLLLVFHSSMQLLQARTSHWLQHTMFCITYLHIGQMNFSTCSRCSLTTSSEVNRSVELAISSSVIRYTIALMFCTNFIVRSFASWVFSATGEIPTHVNEFWSLATFCTGTLTLATGWACKAAAAELFEMLLPLS